MLRMWNQCPDNIPYRNRVFSRNSLMQADGDLLNPILAFPHLKHSLSAFGHILLNDVVFGRVFSFEVAELYCGGLFVKMPNDSPD